MYFTWSFVVHYRLYLFFFRRYILIMYMFSYNKIFIYLIFRFEEGKNDFLAPLEFDKKDFWIEKIWKKLQMINRQIIHVMNWLFIQFLQLEIHFWFSLNILEFLCKAAYSEHLSQAFGDFGYSTFTPSTTFAISNGKTSSGGSQVSKKLTKNGRRNSGFCFEAIAA